VIRLYASIVIFVIIFKRVYPRHELALISDSLVWEMILHYESIVVTQTLIWCA